MFLFIVFVCGLVRVQLDATSLCSICFLLTVFLCFCVCAGVCLQLDADAEDELYKRSLALEQRGLEAPSESQLAKQQALEKLASYKVWDQYYALNLCTNTICH